MDIITEKIVQTFYTRYEEYVSFGESEPEAVLLASQEVSRWMSQGRFGKLSEAQRVIADEALRSTNLYAL